MTECGGIEWKRSLARLCGIGSARPLVAALLSVLAFAASAEDYTYRKLDATRILLMNNDANAICAVYNQGYYDTNTTASTYWVHGTEDIADRYARRYMNLLPGINHTLWQNEFDDEGTVTGRKMLWELVDCRAGSSAMAVDGIARNYLPWSGTAEAIDIQAYSAPIPATYYIGVADNYGGGLRQVATVTMRGGNDARIYSPYYEDGVGDIWFDTVNGWCDSLESSIAVEFATNVAAQVDGVTYTETLESSPNGDDFFDWHAAKMDVYYVANCSTLTLQDEDVDELTLKSTAGATNGFYRVHVAFGDQLDGYSGPIRFRIRRVASVEGTRPDYDDLILVDNVLVSYPNARIVLENYGKYDTEIKGTQIVGQGGVFSVPFPGVGEEGNCPRVKFHGEDISSRTFIASDGSTVTTSSRGEIADVECHYRWRYLNQESLESAWQTATLDVIEKTGDAEGSARASEPIAPKTAFGGSEVGDVEFYFTGKYRAARYYPVDYALGNVGYGVDEDSGNDVELKWTGDPINATGGGEHFFYRLREGASDYERIDVELRYGSDWDHASYKRTIPLELVGDGVWRGAWDIVNDTLTAPLEGSTMFFKFVGRNLQTPGEEWSENETVWVATQPQEGLEASGIVEEATGTDPEKEKSYIATVDSVSGALIFRLDEDTRNYSVTRGEYQNFNNWVNAKKDGGLFTGTDVYTTGVSRAHALFAADTSLWDPINPEATAKREDFSGLDFADYGVEKSEFYTPNMWTVRNGLYVGETGLTNGLAVQLHGLGMGQISYENGSTLPGIGDVGFKARLGQFLEFDDFDWCGNAWDSANYYITGATAISIDPEAADVSPGAPSISVVGYHRPTQGCYEFRMTRLPKGASKADASRFYLRCALYKWTYDRKKGAYTVKELKSIALGTNGNLPATVDADEKVVDDDFKHSLCGINNSGGERKMANVYIGFYNTPSNTVQIVGGISRNMATKTLDEDDFVVMNYEDSDKPFKSGMYGVATKDCFGYLVRPAVYAVQAPTTPGQTDWWPVTTNIPQRTAFVNAEARETEMQESIVNEDWALNGRLAAFVHNVDGMDIDNSAISLAWRYGFYSTTPEESVLVQTRDTTEGGDKWVTREEIPLSTFADTNITVHVRRSQNCYVRIAAAGRGDDPDDDDYSKVRTDVVVDDVYFNRWRGENMAGFTATDPLVDKWVYTAGWTTTNVVARNDVRNTVRLDPARGTNGVSGVMSVRSPLLTNGLSLVRFDFKRGTGDFSGISEGLPCYVIQCAVDSEDSRVASDTFSAISSSYGDSRWETVSWIYPSDVQDTFSRAFYVRGPKNVAVRIAATADLIDAAEHQTENFGSIEVIGAYAWDDPALDEYSWTGWNMRTAGYYDGATDASGDGKQFLADANAPESGRGLSGALNFSADPREAEIDPASYVSTNDAGAWRHTPYIQTPYVPNGIGQVYFRARVYDEPDSEEYPATYVSLYGVRNQTASAESVANTPDEDWEHITDIEIDASTYKMYSWSTLQGEADPYRIIRFVVRGAQFGRRGQYVFPDDSEESYPTDEGVWDLPEYANLLKKRIQTPIERVLLDEVTVAAIIAPRLGFKNARPFRSDLSGDATIADIAEPDEQPLLDESFGFQVEVTREQMFEKIDPDSIKVYLMYYVGRGKWGWKNWTNDPSCVTCELPRASDWSEDNMVFRSRTTEMRSIVPALSADRSYGYQTVQYMMYVTFMTTDGDEMQPQYLTTGWTRPAWYDPIDFNRTTDTSSADFSPYTILDSVSPKRVWFNEVNYYDGVMKDGYIDQDALTNQYFEIAVPQSSDISRWHVRLTEGNELSVTDIASFGWDGVPSGKVRNDPHEEGDSTNSYAFLTVKSPLSVCKSDGSWNTSYRAETLNDKSHGKLDPKYPYAFELVRANNIVEHRIIIGGTTNYVGDIREQRYAPTNMLARLIARDGRDVGWTLLDYDPGKESWSVITNQGAKSSEWAYVRITPTLANALDTDPLSTEVQYIDPEWYLAPNGSNCWVSAYIDSLFLRQSVGDGEQKAVVFAMPKWDGVSDDPRFTTNITYTADFFYRLSGLATNGTEVAGAAGTRIYTLELKNITDDVEIHATADVDPSLATDFDLDEDSRYTPAVLEWLTARSEGLEEEPEIHRSFLGMRVKDEAGNVVWKRDPMSNPLSLTEAYWLDLDPFTTNLVFFQVGAPRPVPLYDEGDLPDLTDDPALTNIQITFHTMVTNIEAGGESWAPTLLRGATYGETSDTLGVRDRWDGPVFKVRARLPNRTSATSTRKWAALRYFVFGPDSFVKDEEAGDGSYYADIEVRDPFSKESAGTYFYPYGWTSAFRDETVWYSLAIEDDTEGMSLSTEMLKADSTWTPVD